MKNKRRILLVLVCGSISILLVLFCVNVYSINQRFPPTEIQQYSHDIPVNTDAKGKYTDEKTVENTFQITASDFKVYTVEELISEHQFKDDDIPEDRFPQYEKKVLMLKVSTKNISDTEQVLELYNVNMQCATLGWSSGVNLNWFKAVNALNPKMSLQPSLKSNESLTLFLPYMIYNHNLSDYGFDNIDQLKFDLVLSLYPKKKLIQLNY